MKKYIFVITGLLISIVVVFSCQKNEEPCKTCDVPDPEIAEVSITLNSSQVDINANYYEGLYPVNNNPYKLASSKVDGAVFNTLFEFTRSYTGSEKPYLIVLYLNIDFTKVNIKSDNLLGFSFYRVNQNHMYHEIFVKDNMGYKHLKEWDTYVSHVITNHLAFNLFELTDINDTKSYITIWNDSEPFVKTVRERNTIFDKMSEYYFQHSNIKAPGWDCGSPCPTMSEMFCVEDIWQGYKCEPRYQCTADNMYATLTDSTAIEQDTLNEAFDSTLLYDFRDDFMFESTIGQKYIDYTYSLDAFLDGDIPLKLMIETAYLLFDYNYKLELLLDTTNHSNDTLIDLRFKNDFIDLLDEYEELSEDTDFQDVIDDIKGDIDTYYNKTIDYILNDIN